MKRIDSAILWGVLLIVAGLLFLVQTLVGGTWEALWAAVFGAVGLVFLWVFLSDVEGSWWAIIPACVLMGLSAIIGAAMLGFSEESVWLGALFLGGIALSFWIIYAVRREFWWAVIPGGVLTSVAALILASQWLQGEVLASVLFFGMALTFGMVYVLPTPHGRMTWAWIPAAVLAIMGFGILLAFTSAVNYFLAVLLILVGLYLLFRQSGRDASLQG